MNTTVLLTGPAGAGKSTVAALWASRGNSQRAFIDVDSLRLLIRAGVALPEHGWTQETQRQWNIGTDLCVAMAQIYEKHDVDCIIDVYAPPTSTPVEGFTDITAELDLRRIILFPSLAVCLERNRRRSRRPLVSDEDMRGNYEDFEWCLRQTAPDHVIDNSNLTLEETVDAIEAELHS
ncbi:hypothetical protein [Actinopolymorpha rutila]|uniref:Shikimate kinase n=1 Tax=Actinopolymorpha rutila TaxID=446787 RepID=A0A852ZD93_9ACTN|nr:hypothetical protein [Actinopolymorpha rutila]NYH87669.1 hypothetical protein [Actinopolymorpha rutila]